MEDGGEGEVVIRNTEVKARLHLHTELNTRVVFAYYFGRHGAVICMGLTQTYSFAISACSKLGTPLVG